MRAIAILLSTVCVLASIAVTHVDAGACGRSGLSVTLVVDPETPFSRGILVALSNTGGALGDATPGSSGGTSAFRIGAVLERGEERLTLSVRSIAPGLAVLVPSTRPRAGSWTVHARTARAAVTARTGAPPPPPVAPAIARIRYIAPAAPPPPAGGEVSGRGSSGPRSSPPPPPIVVVELAEPAGGPGALVAYAVRGTHEVAISWAAVMTSARQVQFAGSAGGRCIAGMRFQDAPSLGQTVRFAFVDADGRVSPRSPPLVVAE